jgi:hypothetical protein
MEIDVPERTEKERKLIDNLPVKAPDQHKCNARTPKGYCKMPPGFRTDHPGDGRCYLHGGRAGRDLKHGIYSKKFNAKLSEEYEKVMTDPGLTDLYSEAALSKFMLSELLGKLTERMESGENVFVGENRFGETVESPEVATLLKLIEATGRNITRISDAESKAKHTLNIKQVNNIIIQIKYVMGELCNDCPIRKSISNKLKEVKVQPVQAVETE